jgi:hypothetical protein
VALEALAGEGFALLELLSTEGEALGRDDFESFHVGWFLSVAGV